MPGKACVEVLRANSRIIDRRWVDGSHACVLIDGICSFREIIVI